MNNFSKIILIIILSIALWWGYDTFLTSKFDVKQSEPQQETPLKNDAETKLPEKETPKDENKNQDVIYIYYLTTDKSGNQYLKPVSRPLPPGTDKVSYAVAQLLSGPNLVEKTSGVYSEIPTSSKIIGITSSTDKIILNITGDFGDGGGSDSIYSRMRQLIKTVLANTNKLVYLHLDGKQVDVLGGEGITFSQPLSEKSLDE